MATPWVILEKRYGGSVANPTKDQLRRAVEELYREAIPNMTDADFEEHGAASLRYGFDAGPMFVAEITRRGTVRFEEWADQDYDQALAPTRTMRSVTPEKALELWEWLAGGAIETLRIQPWE